MFNISALHVWNSFDQAKRGEHPYGGNIAEVYAQHLAPSELVEDPWKQAGKSLYILLKQFCKVNSVCAFVDGRPVGDWMNDYKFFHKCDVRILNGQKDKNRKEDAGEIRQNSDRHSSSSREQISSS